MIEPGNRSYRFGSRLFGLFREMPVVNRKRPRDPGSPAVSKRMLTSVPEEGVALGASSARPLVVNDDTTFSLGSNAKGYQIEIINNPVSNGNGLKGANGHSNGHSNGQSNGGGSILDRPYGYVVEICFVVSFLSDNCCSFVINVPLWRRYKSATKSTHEFLSSSHNL